MAILPLDERAMRLAAARQARLTKPAGSLGRLEDLAVRLAGITGRIDPPLPAAVVFTLAGDDDDGLLRKLAGVRGARQDNADSIGRGPVETLAATGGLEIAGLVGVILEAARMRKPVIIDGFISGSAALVAAAIAPEATGYMIASHRSHELGHGAGLGRRWA